MSTSLLGNAPFVDRERAVHARASRRGTSPTPCRRAPWGRSRTSVPVNRTAASEWEPTSSSTLSLDVDVENAVEAEEGVEAEKAADREAVQVRLELAGDAELHRGSACRPRRPALRASSDRPWRASGRAAAGRRSSCPAERSRDGSRRSRCRCRDCRRPPAASRGRSTRRRSAPPAQMRELRRAIRMFSSSVFVSKIATPSANTWTGCLDGSLVSPGRGAGKTPTNWATT